MSDLSSNASAVGLFYSVKREHCFQVAKIVVDLQVSLFIRQVSFSFLFKQKPLIFSCARRFFANQNLRQQVSTQYACTFKCYIDLAEND